MSDIDISEVYCHQIKKKEELIKSVLVKSVFNKKSNLY